MFKNQDINPVDDKFVYELLRDYLKKSHSEFFINYAAWKKGILEVLSNNGDLIVFDSIEEFKTYFVGSDIV